MKKFWLALLVLPLGLSGQANCVLNSSGTLLSESWNGVYPCGFGGARSCNQTWTGSNIGPAIVSSPTTGTGWCNNSLKMPAQTGGRVVSLTNTFPNIPSSTNVDWYFYIYATTKPGTFDNVISTWTAISATVKLKVFWAGTTSVECQAGSNTASGNMTVNLNTSYLLHIHEDATLANSYCQVNGGTHETFTNLAASEDQLQFGSTGDTTGVYYIGQMYATAATVTGSYPPTMLLNWSGTNGATVTTSTIASDQVGGNSNDVWGGLGTGFTYDNTLSPPSWGGPIALNGGSYTGNSGVGMKFDCTTTALGTLTPQATVANGEIGGAVYIDLPTTDNSDHDVSGIYGSAGDSAIFHIKGTGSQLRFLVEYQTSSISATSINFSPNTWYFYILNFHGGGQHTLQVWNTSHVLQGTITVPGIPGSIVNTMSYGHLGAGTCSAGGFYEYGDQVLNISGIDLPHNGFATFTNAINMGGGTSLGGGTKH